MLNIDIDACIFSLTIMLLFITRTLERIADALEKFLDEK